MEYPFQNEHDVLPSLLFIAHSGLTDPAELENRFQELLNQRSQQIAAPSLAPLEPTDIKDIPSNSIMEFCRDYHDKKDKLDNISRILAKVDEDKNTIETAYKTIMDNLAKLIDFYGEMDSFIDLLKNVGDLKQKALEKATSEESMAKEEHQKICAYISQCIELFGLVKKETNNTNISEQPSKYQCPVCFDKQVDSVYVPCGHTICKECGRKVRNVHCIICRKKAKVIPFFLSA
jgi:hypothetical protein